jgi:hypothetical protein
VGFETAESVQQDTTTLLIIVMCGRCVASRAKPFGKTGSRPALLAAERWSIVASGSSKMSMAVTGVYSNGKTRFQSFFMLTTVQPSFFASAMRAPLNVPIFDFAP